MQNLSSKEITQKSGSNLAMSFFCLSKKKQHAMSVFYAFCRVADDIVDQKNKSIASKQEEINAWLRDIEACYDGTPDSPLAQELQEVIQTYEMSSEPIKEILRGVAMDLNKSRYQNFAELSLYCYRVASAVGLSSIEIFEYKSSRTKEYAVALGMAFQLTNILRDIKYDLVEYERIYIPQEEMDAFGVSEDDLRHRRDTSGMYRLCMLQYHRARHYYAKAERLLPDIDRENLKAASIMTRVYFELLEKLKRKRFGLGYDKCLRLNKIEKIVAAIRGLTHKPVLPTPLAQPKRIAVIGGGFSGIAAATRLSRAGHVVELFEAKPYIGGRAHSYKDAKSSLTLDNGQHILMGCYHSAMELIDHLAVRDKLDCQPVIRVPYHSLDQGSSELAASDLPSPLHMLSALINFKEFSWMDRLAIMFFGIALRVKPQPASTQTVEEWLKTEYQTFNAQRVLWEPLCIAALNEPISTASARLFHAVLKQSLFGNKTDSTFYFSKVGLGELLMPEAEIMLTATGGKIHQSTTVRKMDFSPKCHIKQITTDKGQDDSFDCYISTLQPKALARLLPEESSLKQDVQQITSSPIISVHLILDKKILDVPFVGLLDSPVQWIFDCTSHHDPKDIGHNYHYAVIISAAYETLEIKSNELLNIIIEEVEKHYPEAAKAELKHHIIYKSRDATFAARPEIHRLRPTNITPWRNLFLAGDWIQTQLPATLESAVLSTEPLADLIDSAYADKDAQIEENSIQKEKHKHEVVTSLP
ncbi:MAG: hydroxysqualene dehydroxylase HpnE [Verrucomicrobiota bacterium]